MISILEKDRAPSRIEFREGPWCEQLLGSLRVAELHPWCLLHDAVWTGDGEPPEPRMSVEIVHLHELIQRLLGHAAHDDLLALAVHQNERDVHELRGAEVGLQLEREGRVVRQVYATNVVMDELQSGNRVRHSFRSFLFGMCNLSHPTRSFRNKHSRKQIACQVQSWHQKKPI